MKQTLLIASKVVAGIAGIGVLYGAFVFFDNMQDDIVDIKEVQVEYKATADTTLFIIKSFDDRISANEKAVAYNSGQVEVLRDSYLQYVKNDSSLTKEEFVKYMDPFLEYIKKNSSSQSLRLIPLVGKNVVNENVTGNTTYSSSQ